MKKINKKFFLKKKHKLLCDNKKMTTFAADFC